MRGALDNRIPPPLVALLVAIAMATVAHFTPGINLPAALRYGVAAALLAFALIMGGRAFRAFGRAQTTVNPVDITAASTLVTTGVYRVSRNPMYVSLASVLTMIAVLLSNGWALLGPVLFILFITRFQIIPEERAMGELFGGAYTAYRATVRRWL